MKICCRCEEEKPLSEFGKNKLKKDSHQYYCKSCHKIKQALYYKENKEFVNQQGKRVKRRLKERWEEYKSVLSCTNCGESHNKCLDFHHLEPHKKEFNVSMMVTSYSWENIMKEVKKCVVLCKNCHVKVHDGVIEL